MPRHSTPTRTRPKRNSTLGLNAAAADPLRLSPRRPTRAGQTGHAKRPASAGPRTQDTAKRPASVGRLSGALSWWRNAEPPGGWPLATLVTLAALVAAGAYLPQSPAANLLREWLGMGIPLLLLWVVWLTWIAARQRPVRVGTVAALLVLSASGYLLLALRGHEWGGMLGEWLLGTMVMGFGKTGGLTLVGLLAMLAVVHVLGPQRVWTAFAAFGVLARRLVGRPSQKEWSELDVTRPSRRRGSNIAARVAEPMAVPLSTGQETLDPEEQDIVIMGPQAPAREAATPSTGSSPGPVAAPAPVTRETRDPSEPIAWVKPAPTLLSYAAEGHEGFSPADLRARARVIEETLASFGVQTRVTEVQQGPAITQFGLDPAPGVAVTRIVSRQHDLALRLGAPSLRVLAPVPGRPLVGIEVPNTTVATVRLGDLLDAPTFTKARLPIGIGMDVAGKPVVGDLARMPHLLIAGATGAGKSVSINALIASLLVARTPEEIQLILIDPKQVEMTQYKGLPHLRLPVVTDMDKVVATLRWTVQEMERRYNRFSEVGARNIVTYNERFPEERLGYLVIVIDELADMMMTAADDVERLICRLAQLGRAAGVHLVVATQRPSVDVLTGLIKANLPTRIAFAVSSQTDSRVILDRAGAERLLGRGDALYQPGDEMNPRRVQGAFVSDDEIEAICSHWRAQGAARHTAEDEENLERLARQDDPEEKLLGQARAIFAERNGDVSVSYLQRRLKVGLQKADRILQTLKADEAAAQALPPAEDPI